MQLLHTILSRLNDILTRFVKALVIVMVVGMVSAILWQISMRYIFHRPPSWTEELALLLFSWTMLLMLAVGVRERFHVHVDLLIRILPVSGKRGLQFLLDLLISGFGGYLTWSGIAYCLDMYGSTSAAIGYPMVALYSAGPVCGVLVFLFGLEHLLNSHPKTERQ